MAIRVLAVIRLFLTDTRKRRRLFGAVDTSSIPVRDVEGSIVNAGHERVIPLGQSCFRSPPVARSGRQVKP